MKDIATPLSSASPATPGDVVRNPLPPDEAQRVNKLLARLAPAAQAALDGLPPTGTAPPSFGSVLAECARG